MRSNVFAGMLMTLVSGVAMAADTAGYRGEVSLVVTGTIQIDAAGGVTGHSIDRPRALDPAVVKLIDAAVPGWRFEPLPAGGNVKSTTTPMGLLIVGKQVAPHEYAVRIESAHIGASEEELTSDNVRPLDMAKPVYPQAALQWFIDGTVYLALRIDRSGHVAEAIAEQVNVGNLGSEPAMARGRRLLSASALAAAKRWTFRPPTTGKSASDAFWSARVPVRYAFGGESDYGQWEIYIPGPRQEIPWRDADKEPFASSPEGLVPGQLAILGRERKLLTGLGTN